MARVFKQAADGAWRDIGGLSNPISCDKVRAAMRNGELTLVPSGWQEIEAGGFRLHLEPAPITGANICP